jgi:hypothetical protein
MEKSEEIITPQQEQQEKFDKIQKNTSGSEKIKTSMEWFPYNEHKKFDPEYQFLKIKPFE